MTIKNLRSILSCSLGNTLEWYDFGLFTIFSSLFSQLFFPTTRPVLAYMATISIFSVGFICRPLGALLFGYLGDKKGRADTMRLSILMIILPTLAIGFLPTYQQVGILAPILLTLTRILQGISVGGEYSGSLIYITEVAPSKNRAMITSFASIGANMGILIASVVGVIVSACMCVASLQQWGWRLPYVLSGVVCLLIYCYRLRLDETRAFKYLSHHHKIVNNPIKLVFKDYFPDLMRTIGIVCMGTTFYFFSFIYLPIFLEHQLHYSIHSISILISSMLCMMILLIPVGGALCDKFGRRNMMLFNSALVALVVVPGFYYLQTSHFSMLILVFICFTVASSLEQGTTPVAIIENFPLQARYTGVSLGYNIGNGFLGGTVPAISAWLVAATHFALSPAIYIACCAIISWFIVYYFIPETKGVSLNGDRMGSYETNQVPS